MEISKIPFIDDPEFIKEIKGDYEETVTMEGFRYVSDELDLSTLEIRKNNERKPYGNSNIYSRLIYEELSMDNLL